MSESDEILKLAGELLSLGVQGPDPVEPRYPTSQIKHQRGTRQQVENRRRDLIALVREIKPCSVRQVFYQATIRGMVEKTELGYHKIQDDLTKLRRSGAIPYGWLTDSTRMQRRPLTFNDLQDAVFQTAQFYRRSLWTTAKCQVEIWLEKDALSGVIYPVTSQWDVPLMVARGYASLTFLHSAAEDIAASRVPTFVYHLGDHDPSGVNAAEKIEETLREMAPDAEIHFQRLAVLPSQIEEWSLPTRPTKKADSRAKGFGSDVSVELDAIPPDRLREIVDTAIRQHVDQHALSVIEVAEESERNALMFWAADLHREKPGR